MSTDKKLISKLEETLNSVASDLPKVTSNKMFGCHALFANGNVFALVWKHGRLGVKLTDESDFEKLMAKEGAEPWKAGPMKMSHWVLFPEKMNSNQKAISPWVKLAHEQALSAPPKVSKPTKNKKTAKNK